MLTVLDLFSGIGGFSLGLERTGGFKTVAFVEKDRFCQRVLAKHWPGVPIYDDVRGVGAHNLPTVDVVTGGFPCQPFSKAAAGKRKGAADNRNLWPEMHRIIAEIKPRWVIAENSDDLPRLYLDTVLADLEGEGYEAGTVLLPAAAFGADHIRQRAWILAHASGERHKQPGGAKELQRYEHGHFAPGRRERREKPNALVASGQVLATVGRPTVPGVCRTTDGIPDRVDRLRALGNAVVPQVVEHIGRALLAVEHADD